MPAAALLSTPLVTPEPLPEPRGPGRLGAVEAAAVQALTARRLF